MSIIVLRGTQKDDPSKKGRNTMKNLLKNLLKKETAQTYTIVYRWIGEEETETAHATSGGLAALDADPMIEIISVN